MQLLENYRFWLWRRQFVQLLVAGGTEFPNAWAYSGKMRTYFNEGYAPRRAVLEDRLRWISKVTIPLTQAVKREALIADIRELVRAAWTLCDNTANESPPAVDQADWDNLSAALDKLDQLPEVPDVVAGPATKAEHALLCALSVSRPAVKELKWGQTSYGAPEALSIVGVYRINEALNGGWSAAIGHGVLRDTDGRSNFPTLKAAKAAAQSDFEQRILSSLSTSAPTSAQEVDR